MTRITCLTAALALTQALATLRPARAEGPIRDDAPETVAVELGPAPQEDTLWTVVAWSTVAVGAVALGAGAMSLSIGLDEEATVEDAETDESGLTTGVTQREARRLLDDADRHQNNGAVLITVGGSLIATGLLVYLLRGPDASESRTDPPKEEEKEEEDETMPRDLGWWLSPVVDGPLGQAVGVGPSFGLRGRF